MFKNKMLLMLILFLLAVNLYLHAQQDSLAFPAPQYMLPMYDHFSLNHLNVEAMGRGFTFDAVRGGVESAVNNPATLYSEKSALYMEMIIKPPVDEINQSDNQMYSAPIPFGLIGVSGRLYRGLQGAISYNVPKSIVYDDFTVNILQGADEVVRYPTYYLHQFSTTLAGSLGKFRLGLNIHQQLHQFKDITVYQTFDRIDKIYYVLRVQPGVQYQDGKLTLGAAFMPAVKRKMDIRYEEYDVTIPMQFTAGASFAFGNNNVLAEAEWEQFSQMSDKFKDRLTLKAGYEKRIRDITYRAGLISLPGVYKGAYKLPILETDDIQQLQWWSAVDRGGIIDETSQLFATLGFTYHFKGGKFSISVMRDLLGNVPTTQFATSLGFNLETLKGKKFLIFDK